MLPPLKSLNLASISAGMTLFYSPLRSVSDSWAISGIGGAAVASGEDDGEEG
ncbi:hypothetical protein DY000_02058956 [Brassica cretica]|uniref:Uncharacterized protein n=1 Tax=Brassica cretica TaxID=69181 RepID=A0ABQ7B4E1_BRACR|nr:hypothetical protein DY000_02058956 [Brassica cretica]